MTLPSSISLEKNNSNSMKIGTLLSRKIQTKVCKFVDIVLKNSKGINSVFDRYGFYKIDSGIDNLAGKFDKEKEQKQNLLNKIDKKIESAEIRIQEIENELNNFTEEHYNDAKSKFDTLKVRYNEHKESFNMAELNFKPVELKFKKLSEKLKKVKKELEYLKNEKLYSVGNNIYNEGKAKSVEMIETLSDNDKKALKYYILHSRNVQYGDVSDESLKILGLKQDTFIPHETTDGTISYDLGKTNFVNWVDVYGGNRVYEHNSLNKFLLSLKDGFFRKERRDIDFKNEMERCISDLKETAEKIKTLQMFIDEVRSGKYRIFDVDVLINITNDLISELE